MTNLLDAARAAVAGVGPPARFLGLDLGTKTIGMATCDLRRRIATPRQTIRRTRFKSDAAQLLQFAKSEDIGLLVLGLPLNMDGTEGPRAQSTRSFARNLAQFTPLPIAFWDERLSTAAVQRAMLEADLSRARRGMVVDQLAAAYILQSFLDAVTP